MNKADFIKRFRKTQATSPEATLLGTFLAAMLVGSLLLASPLAQRAGAPLLGYVDALFMAVSATCVTGLTVVDVSSQFSLFGQAVILVLIELGGIGIMTFATFFVVLAGRELTAKSESLISATIGGDENRNLKSLLTSTVALAATCEAAGAAIFARAFHAGGMDWPHAAWHGLFHAVSSFCNAGFALRPDSLIGLRGDTAFMLATCALVIVGSLGFIVVSDILNFRPWMRNIAKRRRLSLHSSLVLRTALLLIVFGTAAFLVFEWDNALAGMAPGGKVAVAAFQSMASRTCGFTTVDMSATSLPTQFLTILQMFIGGAPGSAAGGIKTTTFAVLLLTMAAIVGNRRATLYRSRAIPETVLREAVAVFILSIIMVSATIGALLVTENPPADDGSATRLFFDAVSACSTTGLSLGAAARLSVPGRVIVIVAMYLGRVGPLTAAFMIGRAGRTRTQLKYPEEDVIVG